MATIADFTVTVTPAERRSATLRLYWRTYGKWVTVFGAALFLFGVVVYFLDTTNGLGFYLAIFGLVYPLAAAGLIYFRSGPQNPLIAGEFHFVADDEKGLHLNNGLIDQTVAWSVYRKAALDGPFLFLFLTSRRAQIIPLGSAPGVQPLIEWLRTRGLLAA